MRLKKRTRAGGNVPWWNLTGMYYPRFLSPQTESSFIKAVGELIQQMFIILLVTYLLLLLADTVWEESASELLNLNYLLIAVVVLGVPAVLISKGGAEKKAAGPPGARDILMTAVAAVAAAVIVWFKTRDIGWPSVIMSIISCVLVFILSLLIFKGDDEGKDTEDK